MNKYLDTLDHYFDSWGNLINVSEFMTEINSEFSDHQFLKDNSRLVFSVCPDDVNRLNNRETIEKALVNEYNREFHLGGLGAYPIGGVSGITAASHHPPDNINSEGRSEGNLIFFLSPHMGVIEQDDFSFGKIIRPGQKKITSSCGAMMGFLDALEEAGSVENFKVTPDVQGIDPTRLVLQNAFIDKYPQELQKILDYEDKKKQVTELFKLNYTAVSSKANQMIEEFLEKEEDHFTGNIAIIGGLTVNLPNEDCFILKDLNIPL
ncbi:MAG: hypothetical protein ACOCT9_01445 [archaeon]